MYRRFHINDDTLTGVLAALQELHSLKVERVTNIQPENTMSTMLAEMARVEQKQITSLSHILNEFKRELDFAAKEPTPNEELEAVDAVIRKLIGSERFYPERRAALIDNIVKDAENKRQRAWAMFAKLADDIRIKMLAIKYLLDRAPHAGNHHEKNRRITEVGELIVTVIEEMAKVKEPSDYDHHHTHYTSGSWNYIQAMTEIHHKTQDAEQLQQYLTEANEKNEKLRNEVLVLQNTIRQLKGEPPNEPNPFGPIVPATNTVALTEDEITF